MTRTFALLTVLLSPAACAPGMAGPVSETVERHWQPDALDALELPLKSWPLPPGGLVTGVTSRGRRWVAGPGGLFEAKSDGGLELAAAVSVTALAALESGELLADSDAGFVVFDDGVLRPSQLEGALPARPRLLGSRAGALWLSSPDGLVKLTSQALHTFSAAPGATRLHLGVRSVARAGDGSLWALREAAGSLEAARLGDERELTDALPFGEAVLARDAAGRLHRRSEQEKAVRWYRVALEPGQKPADVSSATLLATDVEAGGVWLESGDHLYRLTGDRSARVTFPVGGATEAAWLDADAALWSTRAGRLWRLGAEAPVRFEQDVLPLYASRCQSCHRDGDARRPALETLEQWRENIDRVLAAVSPADGAPPRMPPGQAPLQPAERSTLTRWKEDGLRP